MQIEITEKGKLLDEQGNIIRTGWARKPVTLYNRENVRGTLLFIKEWDYYYIYSGEGGLALTVADNGYISFYSMTFFDFTGTAHYPGNQGPSGASEVSASIIKPLPLGKLSLPASSLTGDIVVDDKNIRMAFLTLEGGKILKIDYPGFNKGAGLKGEIRLDRNPDDDSIMIATPFEKSGKFYFNEKVNCMPAEGRIESGGRVLEFHKSDSVGVLDWGRGVWTYENTWYWGSASGRLEGKPFGFNIGYGFGDTTAASENILFYDGRGHKLSDVTFHIPGEPEGVERYEEPWRFSSSDGRFELDFVPELDRSSVISLGILKSDQHQVFGKFLGKVILDDGSVLEVKDLHGFAEKVFNRW